jgi:hypothetical protein
MTIKIAATKLIVSANTTDRVCISESYIYSKHALIFAKGSIHLEHKFASTKFTLRQHNIMSLSAPGGPINPDYTENFEDIEKQFAVKGQGLKRVQDQR